MAVTLQQLRQRKRELEDFIARKQGKVGGAFYKSDKQIADAVSWATGRLQEINTRIQQLTPNPAVKR